MSNFCESFGLLIGITTAGTLLIWYFWALFSLLHWFLTMFAVFLLYSSVVQTSLVRAQGFSLMVTTYNYTELKINGIFICASFWIKKTFVSSQKIQKGPCSSPQYFCLFFFWSSGTHQSHHLDGYQAIGINSSFIFAFWALCFWWPSYHLTILSSSQ